MKGTEGWNGTPVIRVLCPSGHAIAEVTVVPFPTGDRISPAYDLAKDRDRCSGRWEIADGDGPWATEGYTNPMKLQLTELEEVFDRPPPQRWRLTCTAKGCSYSGVHRNDRLIELHAAAAAAGKDEIRLTS